MTTHITLTCVRIIPNTLRAKWFCCHGNWYRSKLGAAENPSYPDGCHRVMQDKQQTDEFTYSHLFMFHYVLGWSHGGHLHIRTNWVSNFLKECKPPAAAFHVSFRRTSSYSEKWWNFSYDLKKKPLCNITRCQFYWEFTIFVLDDVNRLWWLPWIRMASKLKQWQMFIQRLFFVSFINICPVLHEISC